MGNRLSKIYTRTGDRGDTGLGDGTRISKDHVQVEAYGTIDELNSFLGLLLTYPLPPEVRAPLLQIQHELFDLGGELCMPGYQTIDAAAITRLEDWLDDFNSELPALKEFVLPGGSRAGAMCHVARTVCRRAERRVVTLGHTQAVREEIIAYLNRLSDLLFVICRLLNREAGEQETQWDHQR
ncbi:MAG TPA: cob(I)yrinic acid a,c-diamide adenosyltransferase [Gammaproteobacteria bacterium]|nr:cob(I)yrinic acid a,c-diamide adenosyltransferase [Gammaproteobacteria bacterium]